MTERRSLDEAARRLASLDLANVVAPEAKAAAVGDLAHLIDGIARLAELGLDETEPALTFSPMGMVPHAE